MILFNFKDQERIREQLRLSRQLTEHKTMKSDDDITEDESVNETESTKLILLGQGNTADNPWMLTKKEENKKNSQGFFLSYKLFNYVFPMFYRHYFLFYFLLFIIYFIFDLNNKCKTFLLELSKRSRRLQPIVTEESTQIHQSESEEHSCSDGEWVDLVVEKKKTLLKDIDSNENGELLLNKENEEKKDETKKLLVSSKPKVNFLEPESFKSLRSDKDAIELNVVEDSSDDDVAYNEEQRMNIREAFANDDVIGDFINEKKEIIENSKQKAVDLTLPGWGDWAGPGLSVSKKKKDIFTKQPKPGPKRKDEHIANVIISEARNTMLAKKQV